MNQFKPQELIQFRKQFKISQGRFALGTGITSYEIGQFEQNKIKLTNKQHKAIVQFTVKIYMMAMYR